MSEARVLSHTESLCPVCLRVIPASRIERGGDVFLEKTCPEHGSVSTVIWRGVSPSYDEWGEGQDAPPPGYVQTEAVSGCPFDCGLCPEHTATTCTVLMEVTDRCNMRCPICFASAQENVAPDPDLDTIATMFEAILEAGGPYPLQLSGGEPTVRDDLPEIVALAKEFGFKHVQVNTNGLRIAREPGYLEALKAAGTDLIYLQLDGVSDSVYTMIRGIPLIETKRRVLERCAEVKVGVQLVPVVIRGVNDHELGGIIELAKEFMPVVKGVHFQPVSYFGRYSPAPSNETRMTTPDVLHALEAQTAGEVAGGHFLPRRKRDSHCGFSAYYILGEDGRLSAATHFASAADGAADSVLAAGESPSEHVRRFITEKSRYIDPDECECMRSARMTNALSRARTYGLSVSGMPFMDGWTVDLARLRNCCVHVVRQDGRLVPFCANYLTSESGVRLPGIETARGSVTSHVR